MSALEVFLRRSDARPRVAYLAREALRHGLLESTRYGSHGRREVRDARVRAAGSESAGSGPTGVHGIEQAHVLVPTPEETQGGAAGDNP